jgi:hypothetical protein
MKVIFHNFSLHMQHITYILSPSLFLEIGKFPYAILQPSVENRDKTTYQR